MTADQDMQQAAAANDRANLGHVFVPALEDVLVGVPALGLQVAAGGLSPGLVVEPVRYDWVDIGGVMAPGLLLSVAQVEGEIAFGELHEKKTVPYLQGKWAGVSPQG